MAGKDCSLSDYMKANASYKMNLIRSSIPKRRASDAARRRGAKAKSHAEMASWRPEVRLKRNVG
jgi:hypothetical protein